MTLRTCLSVLILPVLVLLAGCRTTGADNPDHQPRLGNVVRKIVCLYDMHPWINADPRGDRNPEGVRFKAFLKTGSLRSVHRDGTFHIDIYRIDKLEDRKEDRVLVSDYHYPSSMVSTIAKPGMMGEGYVFELIWNITKDIPGHEIEIVATFEDEFGNRARADTKRLRVPKKA